MKMKELTDDLAISIDTLRRDIQQLLKQGKVKKIYGGIEYVEPLDLERTMDERKFSMLPEKQAIAKLCADYIDDGDCIYIDSGTTTYQIAKYIKQKKQLTVITNSIPVVLELFHSNVEVIMIGGKVRKEEQSIFSHDYLFNFDSLNIHKAFIGAGGISIQKGVSDYNMEEAITRKKIIALTNQIFVAADHTKFNKDALIGITSLHSVNYIITDDKLPKKYIREFKGMKTELLLAQCEEEQLLSFSLPTNKALPRLVNE